MFLKNKNIICKIRRSKVTDYAALIPRNHLDKLCFTFSEEVIVKFQYFFFKNVQNIRFNSKDGYVLVFVKMSYYHKNMPYIYC